MVYNLTELAFDLTDHHNGPFFVEFVNSKAFEFVFDDKF